jgi:hypothetical protein
MSTELYLRNLYIMKKLEESDEIDDVYILHVKRYAIRNCSGLER